MKKFLFFICATALLSSCDYFGKDTEQYKVNAPVFASKAEFRSSVNVTTKTHKLTESGKICFYKGFLYISDPGKGIHIVNNTKPATPGIVGYIEIPGNYDIHVQNDILYADALIDLVWFDIADPSQPVFKGRLEDVFPESLPSVDNEYAIDYEACYGIQRPAEKLIVGWKVEKRERELRKDLLFDSAPTEYLGSSNGQTGSMSRFGLYKNYLYAIINYNMNVFDLSSGTPVIAAESKYVGNVETIFSYKDNLFLGTPVGMEIWSVADPLNPVLCSRIWHVYGCDPVVVDNDLAYVTIHSGNFCGQNNDELFIVDVSDVYHPKQLVSYSMTNPKGLGIDNGVLFLCDDGLKTFRIDRPETLLANALSHDKGMDGYDVIPFDNVLMMIAEEGLYQYDYSDINNIKRLSVLPINK